jgi:cis-3-alkyl-4-acyloxetan-2-one decarboxylase
MFEKIFHKWLKIPHKLSLTDNRKKSKNIMVFLHGIGSSKITWDYILKDSELGSKSRIISFDLLGFGESPKPDWVHYDSATHAKSVIHSLKKIGIKNNVTLVGHSLGSLIAIEVAKQNPKLAKRLVLCSPPLYSPERLSKKLPPRDIAYIKLYGYLRRNPERFLKMTQKTSRLITKFARDFDLSAATLPAYMKSLQASIENQRALKDLTELKTPIDLLYGNRDFLLVKKNIQKAAAENKNITLHSVRASHQISASHAKKLIQILTTS